MDTAILVLERCYLRPYQPSDAAAVHKQADNTKVSHYMTNLFPSPYTLENAHSWIRIATLEREPLRNFAIVKADGTYMGGVGLKPRTDVESRTMEVGYWMGESHWGQGFATEVAAGFTRWAFENIPELLRLEAGVFEGNDASVRVLTKAGYTLEGTRRKAVFKHGKALDVRVLGILREECLGPAGE